MFPSLAPHFQHLAATNPPHNTTSNGPTNYCVPTQNTLKDENERMERQMEQTMREYHKLKEEIEKSDQNLERLRTENQDRRKILRTLRNPGEVNAIGLQDTYGRPEEPHISTLSHHTRPEVRISRFQDRLDLVEWQIGQLITLADLQDKMIDDLEARIDNRDNSQESHCDNFSAQFAESEVILRGGMGGQIEDEEYVYGDGEYVNWDQVDEEREGGVDQEMENTFDEGEENENEEIRELRWQIERLEAQVKKLSKLTQLEMDSVRRQEHSASFSVETSSSHDLSTTRPRLLVERGTVKLEADTEKTKFIAMYMPHRFTLPSYNTGSDSITFRSPVTIYHFPSGFNDEAMQRVIHEKGTDHGRGATSQIIKITTLTMECSLKASLKEFWDDIGIPWDYLTDSDWKDLGEGATYIVTDQEIILGAGDASAGISQPQPHIRGGHGSHPGHPVFESIQSNASDHNRCGEDFERIYDRLLQDAANASSRTPPSDCIDAWIKLATVLQTRNRQIERKLEEFKEIHHSLVQDVCWLIGTQVELEEQLETAEEEKAELAAELEALKTRWETVEGLLASPLRNPVESAASEKLEGQNAELVLWETMPNTSKLLLDPTYLPHQDLHPSTPESSASHIAATCFTFFPSRSTILIPTSTSSSPPQFFQFPSCTTLPQIHSILSYRHAHGLEHNPYTQRIREILEIREEMGITLPNEFKEESVVIGIPDLPAEVKTDDSVKVDAWRSVSQERNECLVTPFQCLKMNTDHQYFSDEEIAAKPRKEGNDEWYSDVGDLVNGLNRMADELNDIDITSGCACCLCMKERFERIGVADTDVCPCWVCEHSEAEGYATIRAQDLRPTVSVRGGGDEESLMNPKAEVGEDDSWPLDQIPVASILPLRSSGLVEVKKKKEVDDELTFQVRRPGDLVVRRGRMFEVHDLRDITSSPLTSPRLSNVPPNSPERLGSSVPRGIGLLASCSPDQSEHLSRTGHNNRPHSREKPNLQIEEDISMFCHPRGEGCETWVPHLNPERDTCEFCHMPFGDERGFEREHSGVNIEHEDDAPAPTAPTRTLPLKLSCKGKHASVEDADELEDTLMRRDIARLRGGAAFEQDLYDREEEED